MLKMWQKRHRNAGKSPDISEFLATHKDPTVAQSA
jgi:hypothetical protein